MNVNEEEDGAVTAALGDSCLGGKARTRDGVKGRDDCTMM